MFKSAVTLCLWAIVFFLSGAQVWSEDMEDRFINPDFDTSKSIFIDVKGVSLINVLKIISQQSNLSFIASQDVADKRITLFLNKVPLDQALGMVLDANGLTYEMQHDSNVFVVKAKDKTAKHLITKVFQLKYASVSLSKLNNTISISGAAGSSSATSSVALVSSLGSERSSSNSKAGSLEEVLQDSLSPDGKVVEDPRTNSLVITDVPSQFSIIESTIANLDVPIPQILIEVEMVDVSKTTADQLGITYGATPLTFTGGSKAENFPFGPAPKGTPAAGAGFDASGMTAALNFIASTTDARTLARPRILTLNNQTAQIEISTEQAISVEPSSTSTSLGSSGSSVTTNTVERATTGVILKVTPQANLFTREITMAVSPKVIDIILSQVQSTAVGSSKVFDPETRGSDSILKLKDGQTMVIGGLMTTQYNNVVTKLPFLGDLPLIGGAFRSANKQKTDRELIIFLTPHIIDDTNQSALMPGSTTTSVQAALDVLDTSDRTQKINNSLNTYDMKN
jgi:type IV pilus assembly protein PilQ